MDAMLVVDEVSTTLSTLGKLKAGLQEAKKRRQEDAKALLEARTTSLPAELVRHKFLPGAKVFQECVADALEELANTVTTEVRIIVDGLVETEGEREQILDNVTPTLRELLMAIHKPFTEEHAWLLKKQKRIIHEELRKYEAVVRNSAGAVSIHQLESAARNYSWCYHAMREVDVAYDEVRAGIDRAAELQLQLKDKLNDLEHVAAKELQNVLRTGAIDDYVDIQGKIIALQRQLARFSKSDKPGQVFFESWVDGNPFPLEQWGLQPSPMSASAIFDIVEVPLKLQFESLQHLIKDMASGGTDAPNAAAVSTHDSPSKRSVKEISTQLEKSISANRDTAGQTIRDAFRMFKEAVSEHVRKVIEDTDVTALNFKKIEKLVEHTKHLHTPVAVHQVILLYHKELMRLLKQLKIRSGLTGINIVDAKKLEEQLLSSKPLQLSAKQEAMLPFILSVDAAQVSRFADYFENETSVQKKLGQSKFAEVVQHTIDKKPRKSVAATQTGTFVAQGHDTSESNAASVTELKDEAVTSPTASVLKKSRTVHQLMGTSLSTGVTNAPISAHDPLLAKRMERSSPASAATHGFHSGCCYSTLLFGMDDSCGRGNIMENVVFVPRTPCLDWASAEPRRRLISRSGRSAAEMDFERTVTATVKAIQSCQRSSTPRSPQSFPAMKPSVPLSMRIPSRQQKSGAI
jgi:hypothetical protein